MTMQIHSMTTQDGILLHLAFFPPKDPKAPVVLCTHGVANTFYSTPLWTIAERINALGWGIAVFNNRGHDWVTSNPIDRRWMGAAHERIEDSAHDFRAGLEWLEAKGFDRVILGGHSLGGLKAAHSLVELASPRVAALAMFSSPRLPDDKVWDWSAHEAIMKRCGELEAQGRGAELMEVEMPTNTPAMRGLMSARTYMNKYGPQAATTTLRFAHEIKVPVFLLAGTEEKPQLSFSVDMEPALVNAESVTRVSIDGADHMYSNRHAQVADAFTNWLERLTPRP